MRLAREHGVPLIGINYKDQPEDARAFLRASSAIPIERIGSDRAGRVGIDWGVYGVPETFVIDAAGAHPLQACRAADRPRISTRRSCRCCGSWRDDRRVLRAPAGCSRWRPALARSSPDESWPTRRWRRARARLSRELRCLVCQNQSIDDFERRSRRATCADRARAHRGRRQRRAGEGFPGRALRRLRAARSAGPARDLAALVRAGGDPADRARRVHGSICAAARRWPRRRRSTPPSAPPSTGCSRATARNARDLLAPRRAADGAGRGPPGPAADRPDALDRAGQCRPCRLSRAAGRAAT